MAYLLIPPSMPQKHNWKCARPVSPQDTGWFEVKMEVNQLDYLPRLKYEERGGCYVCVSHCKDKLGYVRIKHKGKTELAHRVVYELANKMILSKDMIVRHKCDTPSCINPDHLLIGTHNDNVMDRVGRGRSAKGVKNGRSKLTRSEVEEIRADKITPTSKLAEKYNVDRKAIRKIKNNTMWKE